MEEAKNEKGFDAGKQMAFIKTANDMFKTPTDKPKDYEQEIASAFPDMSDPYDIQSRRAIEWFIETYYHPELSALKASHEEEIRKLKVDIEKLYQIPDL